ncbi:hypothetical protein RB195_010231 [Necator americanus]|uniref:Uncharacterized protein n=1 Tax=Necator americanus TaxID=51031 RepID=A0ABR1CYV8_NECAM
MITALCRSCGEWLLNCAFALETNDHYHMSQYSTKEREPPEKLAPKMGIVREQKSVFAFSLKMGEENDSVDAPASFRWNLYTVLIGAFHLFGSNELALALFGGLPKNLPHDDCKHSGNYALSSAQTGAFKKRCTVEGYELF